MNIVVCLKLVWDSEVTRFDVEKNELADLYPVMDPVGYQVLEAGLRLRKANGGKVTVVCLGTRAGEAILRHALYQGADAAIRLSGQIPDEADTWMRSRLIAKGLSTMPCDLILTGAASSDTGNCFMPAALAAHLLIPCATRIVDIKKNESDRCTVVKKLLQGKRETFAIDLPAVVGCAPGINVLQKKETAPLTRTIKITASKPRVKAGINITALSMADRMKMMRGELGTKKEIFTGSANEGAHKIINYANLD